MKLDSMGLVILNNCLFKTPEKFSWLQQDLKPWPMHGHELFEFCWSLGLLSGVYKSQEIGTNDVTKNRGLE